MSFPNKEDRRRCYDARDSFWSCLDKYGEETEKCVDLRKLYSTNCPGQWVKHFDRKRDYLKFKDKILNDGYEPLEDPQKKSN